MDAFIDTLIQLLIDWGYTGLFISALLAGSIIPFSSELVMLALVKVGLNPAICVLAATLGNTMGGMTCYYMGHLGKTDWIEKYHYFDLVYFDAFAPEKQPEMWSEELFRHIYAAMNNNGILTTYCAKGVIRRLLQAIGFRVERLPGPPGGKREILRASKTKE